LSFVAYRQSLARKACARGCAQHAGLSTVRHAHSRHSEKVRPLHFSSLEIGFCESSSEATDAGILDSRGFLFAVGDEVRAQAFNHLRFSAFVEFSLNFFQRKMHDVVMMQLFRSHQIAESQPQTV